MNAQDRLPYSERRSIKFNADEIAAIKAHVEKTETISKAALEIGIERTVLYNILFRGTGAEKTVKQVRKFLKKQTSKANLPK